MGKKLMMLVVFCLATLFEAGLIGCTSSSKKVLNDKNFETTIQKKLDNITNPKDPKVKVSSNPYDYIKYAGSSEDYKYIVSQGERSLNFMLKKFASSNKNGLEEYIMAIACSEILKENPDSKNWSTGREWYNNYLKQKNNK